MKKVPNQVEPQEQEKVKIKDIVDYYVGDFETITTNTNHFMSGQAGRILCYAIQKLGNFNKFESISYKMEDFEQWMLTLKNNSRLFFHNLAFDGLVIADWARYRWNSQVFKTNSPFYWTYQSVKGKILSITILINNKIGLIINCSLRLLNQSIKALGKIVGVEKLEAETYDLEPVNALNELPEKFINYMKVDVEIANRALIEFKKGIAKLNKEMGLNIKWDKPTSASISRDIINALDERKSFKVEIYEQERAAAYYRGGFTAINQDFKDVVLTDLNGQVLDAKSHYPSVIYLNKLPHQTPLILNLTDDWESYEIMEYEAALKAGELNLKECLDFVTIEGKILKSKSGWGSIVWPDHIKQNDTADLLETYIVGDQPVKFKFKGTTREWVAAAKFYEFQNWKITELVQFNPNEATECLKEVTKFLFDFKEKTAPDGSRPWALTFKIILNSLYGSMGMDENFNHNLFLPADYLFLPYDDLIINKKNAKPRRYYNLQKDSLNFWAKANVQSVKALREFWEDELTPEYWNRWIAAYITSIARAELMELIALDFDNLWYCDTDSLIGDKNNKAFKFIEKHKLGNNLGQWNYDLKPTEQVVTARFRAPKNYDLQDREGNILKRGSVGIDKNKLNEIDFNARNFLDWTTTIKDGWKHIVYGIYPEDFERDTDGIVRIKDFTQRLANLKRRKNQTRQDNYYPYIINQDKQLSKLERQRKARENYVEKWN